MLPHNLDRAAKEWASDQLVELEAHFDADVLTMIGPIYYGLENRIRALIDDLKDDRDSLVVILDTAGGIVEVAERIARTLREHYSEVRFLVPDRALSAGTILVMSGDAIMMDYHSCLGPIDPQVEREGKLVPALSYLAQYQRLIEKANKGSLSTAEVVLLQKLDLAELHQFELARDLSITLLKEWLANYKFKDWDVTETRGIKVTPQLREGRELPRLQRLSTTMSGGTLIAVEST